MTELDCCIDFQKSAARSKSHHALGVTSGLKDCVGRTVRPSVSAHVDDHLDEILSHGGEN